MLTFDKDFFLEEVRENYTVPTEIKKLWATELDILSYIIDLCQKNNITYFADWGTLLGTVRHKGFIPWDDDCDIVLKRTDYMKLIDAIIKDANPDYYLSSIYADGDHKQPFSCLLSAKSLPLSEDKIARFYGNQYIGGVDLYVIDYVPRDKELADIQLTLCTAVYDLAQSYNEYVAEGTADALITQIEELCQVQIDRTQMVVKQLWKVYDQLCGMISEEEADMMTWFPRPIRGDMNYYFPKEWYNTAILRSFENIKINVPMEYDAVLTKKYGEKYMTPVIYGEHPVMKRQKEYLKNTSNL